MTTTPRACILSVSGLVLTPEEKILLADIQPWGVILMGRSCGSPDQVRALVDEIWLAMARPCLIFIDQEGGRVARLKAPAWPVFPAAGRFGELYARNEEAALEAAWLSHRLMGHELASVSIHADCAPLLDLPVPGADGVIGDRAFADTPEAAIALARAALDGLSEAGVAGVIKHMPGHGRAEVDSHKALPRVKTGGNELFARDVLPFEALADAPMAMSAHIAYEAWDASRPATQSAKVISDIIRGRIGFQGLLMTDDLGMNALGGSLEDRTRAALAAGCDIALHCSGFVKEPEIILSEMREVGEASPELTGPALSRAIAAEAASTHAKPFDAEAGWARLRELMPELGVAA